MPELGEICFVDSSGGVDRDGTRFFIFLGRCHAGGVPLAIVLATSENSNLLTLTFKTLRVNDTHIKNYANIHVYQITGLTTCRCLWWAIQFSRTCSIYKRRLHRRKKFPWRSLA